MRILHFSDLHIGVENYGRIDLETGLSTRLGDFLDSLDQVGEFALNESVDLVLLAGDAYKGRDPTQTHQREFAKRLNRLSQAGVPIFLLVGNHDLPAASSRATAVDIFPTLEVANVYVGNNLQTYQVPTPPGPLPKNPIQSAPNLRYNQPRVTNTYTTPASTFWGERYAKGS